MEKLCSHIHNVNRDRQHKHEANETLMAQFSTHRAVQNYNQKVSVAKMSLKFHDKEIQLITKSVIYEKT